MSATAIGVNAPERRYERKYALPVAARHTVLERLRRHPAWFAPAYAPRFVNSLYFDTPSFRHYQENVDGIARREKVRIRWYGDLLGPVASPRAERKAREGSVGWKQVTPLPDFELKPGTTGTELSRWLAPPASRDPLDHALEPVLMTRYQREYWISRDGRFRVTIDANVTYHRIARLRNLFLGPDRDAWSSIVELKYDVADDEDGREVARGLPFRMTRSSKYVLGIDRVWRYERRSAAE